MSTQELPLRIIGLASSRERIGIGDVVRELGVSRSAAYRALRTLEQADYLMLAPTGRGYGPGPALVHLAEIGAIDTAAKRRWASVLDGIRDATGETVHAAVLIGSQVLVVDGRRSVNENDMGSRIGMTAPANSMAAGKLLLAALDDRLIRSMIPSPDLPQRTSRTIASADALAAELRQIRHDGFAFAVQESENGVDSIAVPLDGSTYRDRVAAVVSLQSDRGGLRQLRRLGVLATGVISTAAAEGTVHPWRLARRASRKV